MWYIVLVIVAVVLSAAAYEYYLQRKGAVPDVVIPQGGDCATCDGSTASCEQVCMMEAAVKDIEYFNDEELDVYKGRDSAAYTDEEAAEFAEVMYTMRPEEVKQWNRSLILREINMPNQIKDEYISIAGEV